MRVLRTEIGTVPRRQRLALTNRLANISQALGEEPFWGIDEEVEASLEPADQRTNNFSLAVWGKQWRDVLGHEQRPLNRFDPEDPVQAERYHQVLSRMRLAATDVLGSAT